VFTRIAFTEAVKAEQQARGTREFCANVERRQPSNDVLAPRAIAFIESVVCNRRDFPHSHRYWALTEHPSASRLMSTRPN
jgi:hypothetical protein